ncbi:hypothetical protein [Dankookia sp. P2]|uniref:hypothetical protein n=1 Tax=Dankookia sp. P2 TaxID=3423955 RepID=UPI003D679FEF
MDDFDESLQAFQRAAQARRSAAGWLDAFEAALAARDAARIGALFHADSHWRDILAFTWHLTPAAGRDAIALRLAAEQGARPRAASTCRKAGSRPARSSAWASTASRRSSDPARRKAVAPA